MWPAKIVSIIVGRRMNVLFFGDETTSILSKVNIIPFELREAELPVKRPLLQIAILQAITELQNRKSSEFTSNNANVVPIISDPKVDDRSEKASASHTASDKRVKDVEFATNPKSSAEIDEILLRGYCDKEQDAEAVKLSILRQEWEQMDEDLAAVDVLNLKSMYNDDIIDTFQECENILSNIFSKYAKIPDRQIESHTNLNYLLILHELVTPNQQCFMYKKLRQEFTGETKAITSIHENLIWKALIPEWCLLIFMGKFKLTYEESIERIQLQDKIEALNNFDMSFDY
ncbi:uncharacterized protein LOC129572567 [Sitodiplosis mosellana]|uniref:uncharacterized protein LOC129572567 n=1 Tax=Sitodiplosis mosellana TaxID=263140 RepID=UPI0024442A80|nr:uncharacterized protein LOC129572567 [Sitodiplosis mosellana]